ncbi:azurin [Luteimonas sp. MC1750]|uniref:azurin n=1 Tax=Luteimonas sp. MC1750 TaxID=2799326 RepID=UPI0018F090DC|nr:azurin [Luteimonas sp. MC1750]MBJ6984434.1 azurin [Luteimonas sp. MC1750]QQO04951.1 azurin [Luteimonas sp. MC1750]
MKFHASLIAAACALALSACGGESQQPVDTAAPAPAPATPADTAPVDTAPVDGAPVDGTTTPATGTAPAATDPTAAGGTAGAGTDAATSAGAAAGGEAVVTGCSVAIEGNDMMKFNVSSITVPSSCSEFTINLTHVGRLPEAAMGHNVVVTAASNMASVAADGISAGASAGYVKAGDDRVVAATEMIGGGESTSVTFDVSKLKDGGPYQFFCSFPGHAALMKGSISVG